MRLLLSVLGVIAIILHCAFAPPVSPNKSKEEDSDVAYDLAQYTEYHRYLQEVVQALESDPEFRERLEKANEEDVRSGKIAEQLDFVNHNVRTKLDEIKRRELERLRHLATKKFELTNDLDVDSKVSKEHLDHVNQQTFEIEDLKKLIQKTTADLEEADNKRREQFKEYEMQKEFEKHQKLEEMDDTHKKEYLEKVKQEDEAKKHHKPLHHPGSKQQLEEVWDKQDHMDQQFDPKAFFMMHDVDGNGVWDPEEVKALFIKELDKVYTPDGPNKDRHERAEEMERMREHVFQENDRNRDGLIDYNEFIMETQRSDFDKDEGWKSIDENQIYTQNEYEAYEHKRQEEIKYLQQRGLVDIHGRPIPGAEHQIHQALQQKQAFEQQQHPSHYAPGQHQQGQQQYQQGQQQYQQGQPQYQQGQPHYQQGQPQYQQGQPQYQQGQPQYQQGQPQYQQGQPQYQQGQPQYQQGQPQYQQVPQGHQGQPQQFQVQQGQPQQFQGQQGQVQIQQPNTQQNLNQGQNIPAQSGQPAQGQQAQAPGQVQGQRPNNVQGQVPVQAQEAVQSSSDPGKLPQGQNVPILGQQEQLNPSQAPPSVISH